MPGQGDLRGTLAPRAAFTGRQAANLASTSGSIGAVYLEDSITGHRLLARPIGLGGLLLFRGLCRFSGCVYVPFRPLVSGELKPSVVRLQPTIQGK